ASPRAHRHIWTVHPLSQTGGTRSCSARVQVYSVRSMPYRSTGQSAQQTSCCYIRRGFGITASALATISPAGMPSTSAVFEEYDQIQGLVSLNFNCLNKDRLTPQR